MEKSTAICCSPVCTSHSLRLCFDFLSKVRLLPLLPARTYEPSSIRCRSPFESDRIRSPSLECMLLEGYRLKRRIEAIPKTWWLYALFPPSHNCLPPYVYCL